MDEKPYKVLEPKDEKMVITAEGTLFSNKIKEVRFHDTFIEFFVNEGWAVSLSIPIILMIVKELIDDEEKLEEVEK